MALSFINPHKDDRPQDFADARFENGLFRCQRCEMLWPLPIREQDGFRLCQRCWDPLSAVEAQKLMAEERARNASDTMEYLDFPVVGAFDAAPIIQSISPLTLTLTRGGASKTLAIVGLNLTTSDTWAASDSHITVTPTVNSSTSVTLTISAGGATARADYDLSFNSVYQAPRGIFKVR